MILEMAVSQFSLIVSNSIGDGRADESTPKSFVDDFPFSTDLVFVDFFWVNKGCERFWIHASPLEGVQVMIYESAGTQFLFIIC